MLILLFAGLMLIFVAALFIIPVDTAGIVSHPRPVCGYTESMRLIEDKIALEKGVAADYGKTRILSHGAKVKRAVVLYHGFTNCPRQYEKLAERFFSLGYNVYVPRMVYHGLSDRFTKEIGKLKLKDLIEGCDHSVDIAQGLGDEVIVLGLSMGGVMAAFNAQFRNDIRLSMILVPSFAWYFLPGIIKPIINVAFILPNLFLWWDPKTREKRKCPFSMYHHFPTRPTGDILKMGLAILRAAKKASPLTKDIVIMTNEIDIAVDEISTRKLAANWIKHGARLIYYRFSKELKMEHDIIDPLHPNTKTDFVYDRIIEHIDTALR
ncbi:MAG: alpha/beta hydrolase [Candidatus Omnitrophica bacterium]|nr:alpha/beta hydrolase [Candidatus Omnitrophota bacterium]